MSNQPPFWLQVTNQYVKENFESLLHYVRLYIYNSEKDHPEGDFMRTYKHLKGLADEYAAQLRDIPFYELPEFDIPVEKVLRIIAAAILTGRKTGVTDYALLQALIHLILVAAPELTADTERQYFRMLRHCIEHSEVVSFGFSWYTIEAPTFMIGALAEKLAATEFVAAEESDDSGRVLAKIEGKGMLLDTTDRLILTNINYTEYKTKARQLRKDISTEVGFDVRTLTGSRKGGVTELMNLYPVLPGEFDKMRPSVLPQKKTYRPEDTRMVRILRVTGIRVEAETVDPAYEYERGNVYLDKEIMGIPNECLLNLIHPGDYLAVKGGGMVNGLPFRIDWGWIGDLLEDFAREVRDDEQELVCMFLCKFGTNGTRWLTEDGVMINLFDTYLNDTERAAVTRAREENLKCWFTVHDYKRDNEKCIINGRFAGIESDIPQDREAFINEAHYQFMENLLDDTRSSNASKVTAEHLDEIDPYTARLLGILLYRLGQKMNHVDTCSRIEYYIGAMLMLRMMGADRESEYVRLQLDYQKALIGFARGRSPFALPLPDCSLLPGVQSLEQNVEVVKILQSYLETTDTSVAGISLTTLPGDRAVNTEVIEKLVEASNALVGRIDESELNRIKKTICLHLGVVDEYQDIYTSGTNYGVESEFLEFKASCVEPPAQWRTNSKEKDIELQKWNILKAVCAFLNSKTGGELLIGVSDSGFALGLNGDIQTLFTTHRIAEPNIDRLRNYVKLFIDSAFTTSDGRASGTAVTAGRVEVRIETSDQGRDLLRVKVDPYPWDVVRISLPNRPYRFADTYIRTSGASTPLDNTGVHNLKMDKIRALDRYDFKTSVILQAIDERRVIEIKDYTGYHGMRHRRLEPFKLITELRAFLAYDLDQKDMRILKLSRFKNEDIKITQEKWHNETRHSDREVDIFGQLQKGEDPGHTIHLLLSDYARSLLSDECMIEASRFGEMVSRNLSKITSNAYPWRVTFTVYSFSAVARFVMGLPGNVCVVDTPELDKYIKEKEHTR